MSLFSASASNTDENITSTSDEVVLTENTPDDTALSANNENSNLLYEDTDNLESALNSQPPSLNHEGGIYNQPFLDLELNINEGNSIFYSWDNTTWMESNQSVSFNLSEGIHDLYYENENTILHQHYIIDNQTPTVWSSHISDLYSSPIQVNLSSWDNLDNNPKIYYTLDKSNPLENGLL